MPITLLKREPIIHNRDKYAGRLAKAIPKCYEWTRNFVAWETAATWRVEIPEKLLSPESSLKLSRRPSVVTSDGAREPTPGLAVEQVITFDDVLYDVGGECGKITVQITELFPLGTGKVQYIYDPNVHGWKWSLDCGFERPPPGSTPGIPSLLCCRFTSDVKVEMKFVKAGVLKVPHAGPVPFSGADVPNSGYALVTETRASGVGMQKERVRRLPGVSVTPASSDDNEIGRDRYKAEIDHCSNWKALDVKEIPGDLDILAMQRNGPAGGNRVAHTRPTRLAPPQSALVLASAWRRIAVGHGYNQALHEDLSVEIGGFSMIDDVSMI